MPRVYSFMLLSSLALPSAAWRSLLRSGAGPSEGGLYLSPPHYTHALDGPAYSAPSLWYLTQWDTPQQLNASGAIAGAGACPDDAASPFRTLWHVEGSGGLACMQVDASSGAHALLVRQVGSALPCGAEFDSFLAPTDKAYANAPLNILPNTTLGAISGMVANFSLELLEFSVAPRCGPVGSCGPSGHLDYGYITLGIVLSAGTSTIFYQVILSDTRAPPSCPANDPCAPFAFWYGSMPTLGFSESVANAFAPGSVCLKQGSARSYSLATLYDRLTYSVAQAAERYGTNSSLSAWEITGVYLGPGMEGSTTTVLRTHGLSIEVQEARAADEEQH